MAKDELDIDRCIDKAKEFLNQGNAKSALDALESFARNDSRGLHTARPDFYRILWAARESLGIESDHAVDGEAVSTPAKMGQSIGRIFGSGGSYGSGVVDTKGMTWMTALETGERLLKEGKARESIACFRFSISDNPGEYGTSSALDRAREGIRAAEKLLNRMRSTDVALTKKK